MGIRKKTVTLDCPQCKEMDMDDYSNMICHWGKGKPKTLEPQKGKKSLYCNLIKS